MALLCCHCIVLAQHYTACFNDARSIISVPLNAVMAPQLHYNAISTTFNHQILSNMAMHFDLCWQNSRHITLFWYTTHHRSCESAISQINLPTDFAVQHCYNSYIKYICHVGYHKNNYITSPKENTTAPWSHSSPMEHNLEPDNLCLIITAPFSCRELNCSQRPYLADFGTVPKYALHASKGKAPIVPHDCSKLKENCLFLLSQYILAYIFDEIEGN